MLRHNILRYFDNHDSRAGCQYAKLMSNLGVLSVWDCCCEECSNGVVTHSPMLVNTHQAILAIDLTFAVDMLQRSDVEEEENLAQALKMSLQETISAADTKPGIISTETIVTTSSQQLSGSSGNDAGSSRAVDAPAPAGNSAVEPANESALHLAGSSWTAGVEDETTQAGSRDMVVSVVSLGTYSSNHS